MSTARRVFPSRLELNRPDGSSSDAPFANVTLTWFLYVSPVQIMPSRYQTGTPRHFHSSTTSGSACLISSRSRASISPRQSPSSLIRASISSDGDVSPWVALLAMGCPPASVCCFGAGCLDHPAGPFRGLFDPAHHQRRVGQAMLVDVDVAGILVLRRDGRQRVEPGAVEEGDFDVTREAVDPEEPAVLAGSVKRRIPFHRLAQVGDGALDQGIELLSHRALPFWHRRDIGLH